MYVIKGGKKLDAFQISIMLEHNYVYQGKYTYMKRVERDSPLLHIHIQYIDGCHDIQLI